MGRFLFLHSDTITWNQGQLLQASSWILVRSRLSLSNRTERVLINNKSLIILLLGQSKLRLKHILGCSTNLGISTTGVPIIPNNALPDFLWKTHQDLQKKLTSDKLRSLRSSTKHSYVSQLHRARSLRNPVSSAPVFPSPLRSTLELEPLGLLQTLWSTSVSQPKIGHLQPFFLGIVCSLLSLEEKSKRKNK